MLDIHTLEYYCCWIVQSCPTLCDPMNYSKPGLPFPHHLPKFAQVHVHRIGDAIQPSHPLTPLHLLASTFPSFKDFCSELAVHIRWSKCRSFSSNISPSNECAGLFPLRLTGLISLLPKGLSTSLLQHHHSKTSILWCSAFFMIQLSQPLGRP